MTKTRKPVKAEKVRKSEERKAPDKFVAIVYQYQIPYVGKENTSRYHRVVEKLSANQSIYTRFTATREDGMCRIDWTLEKDQMAGIAVRRADLPLKYTSQTEAAGLSKLYDLLARR